MSEYIEAYSSINYFTLTVICHNLENEVTMGLQHQIFSLIFIINFEMLSHISGTHKLKQKKRSLHNHQRTKSQCGFAVTGIKRCQFLNAVTTYLDCIVLRFYLQQVLDLVKRCWLRPLRRLLQESHHRVDSRQAGNQAVTHINLINITAVMYYSTTKLSASSEEGNHSTEQRQKTTSLRINCPPSPSFTMFCESRISSILFVSGLNPEAIS